MNFVCFILYIIYIYKEADGEELNIQNTSINTNIFKEKYDFMDLFQNISNYIIFIYI